MKAMLALAMGLACACSSFAGGDTTSDGFTMRHNQMLITQNGATKVMMDDLRLQNGTEVRTDGVVIPEGEPRFVLNEGDRLAFDGTLTRAGEGAAAAMSNGIAMKSGQVLITKNGDTSVLKGEVTLNDGTKVSSDGTVTSPGGKTLKLNDGDSISMDGRIERGAK
ncbi:MAG: DUF6799 domain-containing protein [Opitutaceae bacterium]